MSPPSARVVRAAFVAALATALVLSGAGTPAHADDDPYFRSDNEVQSIHSRWMSWLPNTISLAELSIPGTHDSGAQASVLGLPFYDDFVETQGLDIRNQLIAGIRYWDVRIAHTFVDENDPLGYFAIEHGNQSLQFNGRLLTFNEILGEAGGFLQANPSETLLMKVNTSGNDQDDETLLNTVFERYRDTHPQGSKLWRPPGGSQALPTLGDVRGKIVVLHDWTGSTNDYGLDADNYESQNNWQSPTKAEKWNDVRQFLDATSTDASGLLRFNNTSAAADVDMEQAKEDNGSDPVKWTAWGLGLLEQTPEAYAKAINSQLLGYLAAGRVDKTGIIVTDFVGGALIDIIIGHNYDLAVRPYQPDMQQSMPNFGHFIDDIEFSEEDDWARSRHGPMVGIARHLVEGAIHAATLKDEGDWSLHTDNNGLAVSSGEVHDFYYHVWRSGGRPGTISPEGLRGVVRRALPRDCDKLDPPGEPDCGLIKWDDNAEVRKQKLVDLVKREVTYHRVAVLVKDEPGPEDAPKEFAFTRAPGSVGVVEGDAKRDYLHAVWVYDGPQKPAANAGGPYPAADEGGAIVLDASGSTDPGGLALEYCWDLDGSAGCETSWSSSPTAQITKNDDYTGNVTVHVRNAAGLVDTATAQVVFRNVAPQPRLSGADSVIEGSAYALGITVTDPGTADTITLDVAWGDGTSDTIALGTSRTTTVNHTYADDDPTGTASDTYTLRVTATDDDAGSSAQDFALTVNNALPEVSLSTASIDEGGRAVVTGTISDASSLDSFEVVVDWKDGGGPEAPVSLPAGTTEFELSHIYADDDPTGTPADTYEVAVSVTDDDLGQWNGSTTVDVANVAPDVALNAVSRVSEGGAAVLQGTITDPGVRDSFDVVVDWGEGPEQTLQLPPGTNAFRVEHVYADDDPTGTASDQYLIDLRVTDDDTGEWTGSTTVDVDNVAPEVVLTGSRIDENGVAVVSGTISDPGTRDSFTVVIDWKDGGGPEAPVSLPAGTTEFELSHRYLDDNPTGTPSDDYTVEVSVTDDDTGRWSGTTTVTVDNVAPEVSFDRVTDSAGNSVGPVPPNDLDVVLLGLDVTVEGSFTDVGTLDTHESTIDWGDGTQNAGSSVSPIIGTHAYQQTGLTTVTIRVTDDDTGSDSATREIRVVNACESMADLIGDLEGLASDPQTPRDQATLIDRAISELEGAAAGCSEGDRCVKPKNSTLVKLRKAGVLLDEAGLTVEASQLRLTAKSLMVVAIDASEPGADKPRQQRAIAEARELIVAGDEAGPSEAAVEFYRESLIALRPALDC